MKVDKGISVDDLLEVHSAGARRDSEKSRALPQHCYDDPAKHVKFASEKCIGCQHERILMAEGFRPFGVCTKKKPDGSKRLYGKRCTEFKLKDITRGKR